MAVTIADVAKVAGVAPITVSRVLNNSVSVRPVTRRRVEEAVSRLSYRPHILARSLASGKSMAVGAVVSNLSNPGIVQALQSAQEVAASQGYSLLLTSTYEDPEREAAAYRQLMERRVDGILIWTRRPSPELRGLVATGPPVICLGTRLTGERVGTVLTESRAAALEMARHLIGLGYRRIALLAGPAAVRHAHHLQEGLSQGLREAGLELPPEMVVMAGAQIATGYQAARELLARRPLPDAIFAYNDPVAAGALMACRELGLRVPEDMGLVGCEDSVIARILYPPLTTIDVRIDEQGATAMELLLALMRGEERESWEIVLPCFLVIRQSCGAALRKSPATA